MWQSEAHELFVNSLRVVGVSINIHSLPCFIMLPIITGFSMQFGIWTQNGEMLLLEGAAVG